MGSPAPRATLRLRALPRSGRLGLTGAVLVLLLGLWASNEHLRLHHQNRDQRPGVSLMDIVGAYHGVSAPSALRSSLERGHPPELAEGTRSALLRWLASDPNAISRDYDNLDLGDFAPSELIAGNCLHCHGQAEAATTGGGVLLANWDSVKRLAFPVQIEPVPYQILVASTHAHAMTLAGLAVVTALLLWCSRWRPALSGVLLLMIGGGLILDVGGWWATRWNASFVYSIVAGGALYNVGTILAILLTLAELWLPPSRSCGDSTC